MSDISEPVYTSAPPQPLRSAAAVAVWGVLLVSLVLPALGLFTVRGGILTFGLLVFPVVGAIWVGYVLAYPLTKRLEDQPHKRHAVAGLIASAVASAVTIGVANWFFGAEEISAPLVATTLLSSTALAWLTRIGWDRLVEYVRSRHAER